ncbi:MAG: ribonuclease P protein component [Patescibacteria group bacterium]|nr:MAG: ribonuclease P protein component [Patescibacteria group bacterium]WKZ24815.1 MAG: ribonuclease P protein component [Patescibacteria group bacterium]
MLPKANCIRLTRDFERIFSEKRALNGKFIKIKVIATGLPVVRFGIITSTKVSKKAVLRNKIRRRIKSILAKNLIKMPSGFDVVVICSPAAAKASFSDLQQDINESLSNFFKD